MPCVCSANLCNTCACGKKGHLCDGACHGGRGAAGNDMCLNTKEGQAVAGLPLAEVRKTLAQCGQDVMGNANELKRRLADYLKTQAAAGSASTASAASASSASSSSAGDGGSHGGGGGLNGAALIRSALDCGDNYAALLSLSGTPVSARSPVPELRRAYLKLSLALHPDKNGSSAESKQAFQLLVSAFERLSQPSGGDAEEGGERAGPRERVHGGLQQRSNEGCVQTRVYCPRCKMDWPRKELGLEDGAYNFFMMGLKEYTCGRCMCLFGCMSAQHECPGCRKPYEYAPGDYHRVRVCGNAGCSRSFGFMQYPVSARRLGEVKKELAVAQEERMKRADAAARRQGRAKTRVADVWGGGGAAAAAASSSSSSSRTAAASSAASASGAVLNQEALFRLELVDECPRCGATLEAGGESPEEHLEGCTDAKAHAAHAASVRARAAKASAATSRAEAAEDASALARWEAAGRVVGSLWTLPPRVLASLCVASGLDGEGAKVDLIRGYAAHCRAAAAARAKSAPRMIMDAGDSGSSRRGSGVASSSSSSSLSVSASVATWDVAGIADLDTHELPSNLHALEADQLACVCAACGLPGDAEDGKAALIRVLERARFKGQEEAAGLLPPRGMLEDGGRGRGAKTLKNYAEPVSGDDDGDDDSEEEDDDEEDFVDDDDDGEGAGGKRMRGGKSKAGGKKASVPKRRK